MTWFFDERNAKKIFQIDHYVCNFFRGIIVLPIEAGKSLK